MAANDKISEDINKRTNKIAADNKSTDFAQAQMAANQVQQINSERRTNMALQRQELEQQSGTTELLASAGAMTAMNDGSGATIRQLNPATQAMLGKYTGGPRVQQSRGHDVKVQPNHIVIHNNYNTTTTNNVSAGPLQGREVSIKPVEPPGQSRFKTWISNVFARQKEETIRREKEYDKREWSLAKSANKMLRKMEDATRSVAETFNPKNLGTTIGSQFKTLLFLFGLRFLAKNWTRVLSVSKKIFEGVGNIVSFLGFGPEGKKLAAKGDDLAGKFIKFFGGDPKKDTILSLLKEMFTEVLDHIRLYFEKQMALRGAAIKSIKFPGFNFGNDNQDKGWLGNMMDSLFSKLGIVFSGVTGYLGDILTALVDPKAGVSRNIIREGLDSSKKATERKGEASMFKNHDNGFNAGDYALVEKGDNGRKKYSLLANALEGDGSLKKTAAAQISQGRDILGTINDAQEYGKLDSGRLMSGLERLYNSAKRNKSVVVDKEFIDRLFGPNGLAKLMSSGQATEVRMKFVEDKMTAEDHALEEQYYAKNHFMGNESVLSLGAAGALGGAALGTFIPGVGTVAGGAVGAVVGTGMGLIPTVGKYIENNDKKYTLVPEDDPRPAAIIDGKRPGIQTFYSITPEALQSLAKNSFGVKNNRGFDSSNYEALIANSEKYLTGKAGGEAAANQKWHRKGQAFFGEDSAQRTDYGRYQELKNIEDSYDTQLKNDAFSRRWTTVGNNAKDLMNQGIGYLNRGIDRAANKYMDMTSAKNATYSYDARPIAPVDTGVQFNPQAAVEALHRNAFPTPQKRCAEMTRKAIAAGLGIPDTRAITGTIISAADYSGALGKLGYAPLSWSTYQPRVGDVLVEPRLPGHENGHMAMYDGTRWVSDFPQHDMWGGTVFKKYKRGIVFRHLSMGGGDSNMLQMDNNTVQTQDPEYYGASSYSSYVGDGGYGFSASGNIGGANFNVSGNVSGAGPISTSQTRGEWFNQHRQKWEGVLRQAGYNESDSTRLSTFFAAQDGVESGGDQADDATKARHNWGGMKYKKKLLSFNSDEEYMQAKLETMKKKFKNAMKAQDLPSYIRMLHDPRVNKGFAYNVAEGFDAKTMEGWDAQQRAMENYVRGSLSFARSGMQYGGDNNPLFAIAADGSEYAYNAPDIPSFSVKTPAQLAREKDMMIHRDEAAKIWNLAKDNNMVLIDPETKKAFTAEHFIELYATGRIKREDIKNRVKNYAEGRRYYNELDPYVKNKYFKGKSEVQFARDMKNMSQSEVKGFKQYYDRISMGMQNYDTWMKGLTKEELKEFAKAIGATNYGGRVVDFNILKAQYEAVLKGMFNRDDDTSNRFAASILYGQDYFNSGEQGKKKLAEMAKNTETYMSSANKMNTKYSAQSKVDELTGLQKAFASFEDKKRALELKYDKIIREAGVALTEEEFLRISEQFQREYNDLIDHQDEIQKSIDKLVESAQDEEKEFLKKKIQQEKLLRTSREELQTKFTELKNENASYIDAVNKLVGEYGRDVLEKLYGVKGLTVHDLEDRDFGAEYEAQRKKYEANVEKYGSDTSKWPSPITRDDGSNIAASAYRRNVVAGSKQGQADGVTKAKGSNIIAKGEADKLLSLSIWSKDKKVNSRDYSDFQWGYKGPISGSSTTTAGVTYTSPVAPTNWVELPKTISVVSDNTGRKVIKKGHAEGGYTEDGPKYKEAGVVHAGEWVAPQWMVKSAKFGPIIGALESSRIKARAIGDSKKAEGSLNDASRGDIVKAINQTTIAIAAASQTNAQNITNAANHASEVIQASARLSAPTRQAQVTPSITTNR